MTDLLARIRWVWVLIGWTIFLWISRLRNVVNNDDLTSTGRAVRVLVVVVFVSLAVVTGLAVWRRWAPARAVIAVLLSWTVVYWLVRGIGILIDGDYSAGFKAVHTVLMVVSLTLAALAGASLRDRGKVPRAESASVVRDRRPPGA